MAGHRSIAPLHRLALLLAASLLMALGATGCGGGGEEATPASLKPLLLPVAQLKPLQLERTFGWDNPTDFTTQGVFLPEATPPSEAIAAMDDANFEAAAGQEMRPKGGSPDVHVDVARFGSADGARQALSYLHGQDLQHPCFASCSVSPRPLTVKGVPSSEGVYQAPNGIKPPPGSGPFERYVLEFAIGPDLFIVDANGGPGDTPPAQFDAGARTVYRYAAKQLGTQSP